VKCTFSSVLGTLTTAQLSEQSLSVLPAPPAAADVELHQ